MRFLQVEEPVLTLVQGQSKQRKTTKRRKIEHSAEQPAPRQDPVSGLSTASKAIVLRERTPLYDSFLDSMQKAEAGTDILAIRFRNASSGSCCIMTTRVKSAECLSPSLGRWR